MGTQKHKQNITKAHNMDKIYLLFFTKRRPSCLGRILNVSQYTTKTHSVYD